jgi:hypothetical protein
LDSANAVKTSDKARNIFASIVFAEPCSPEIARTGKGAVGATPRTTRRPPGQSHSGREDQKRPQLINRSTPRRQWQGQHAARAAKADRNVVNDPPALGTNLDRAPEFIRQIERSRSISPIFVTGIAVSVIFKDGAAASIMARNSS